MAKSSESSSPSKLLPLLLAMAMFVLVVDTSLMNVSISAVVKSLDTTVNGVQAAIALEALVSAAFILISSKLSDIFGRKKSYIIGLIAYGIGALAMALAHNLATVIVLWAIVGGLGAALLLPAMQSLIHGNFEGAAQKKTYALVGATAAIAAAVGPLVGGFLSTYLSYRFAFFLEFIVVAIILVGSKLIRDVPYTGSHRIDYIGAALSIFGMGGVVLGILAWQEGVESVGVYVIGGLILLGLLAWWLVRQRNRNQPVLIDPRLFRFPHFRLGISSQMMQNITLGGAMIALPIFLQISLEYNSMQTGLSIAPLSLSMFFVAMYAGRRLGHIRPSRVINVGFILTILGILLLLPVIPHAKSGLLLAIPLLITGSGLGLLVSQLNNYTLAPIDEKHVSEAAGINSAAGSFGLSFGLAVTGGVLLAVLSFNLVNLTNTSTVIPSAQKDQITTSLKKSTEVVSNAQLQAEISNQPQSIQQEALRINETAIHRALQVALIVPLIAATIGLLNSIRMEKIAKTALRKNTAAT